MIGSSIGLRVQSSCLLRSRALGEKPETSPGLSGQLEQIGNSAHERHLTRAHARPAIAMSQKSATDELAAPLVLRSASEPAIVEETPVRASADSAEAFEEERAVMPADESDAAEVARLRRELHAKDAAEIAP